MIATLVIEERRLRSDASAFDISVIVHPAGTEPTDWDGMTVELREQPDVPATVRLRGGSPADLPPAAARALTEALTLVAGWADDLNAPTSGFDGFIGILRDPE